VNVTAPRDSSTGLLSRAIVTAAIRDSLSKLAPRVQGRNAVTLGVYVASIFTTIIGLATAFGATDGGQRATFFLAIAALLWLSILLANFGEALADEYGKARAATLRSMGRYPQAKRLLGRNRHEYRLVDADALRRGDLVLVEANDIVPVDGTVIEGAASVSEAAVTGESAPVLRAAADDLSFVRSGTHVLSDWLVMRVRSREGGFFDPLVTISQGTWRFRTSQEMLLWLLLSTTTIAFLLGVAPLSDSTSSGAGSVVTLSALVALLVCSIPLTIRASVAAMGVFCIARLMRVNVIAASGDAVEAAANIDVLVLDKTGTITRGDRRAVAFQAAPGVPVHELLDVAQLASLSDETPEGRSIVALVTEMQEKRPDLSDTAATFHEFSAQTRISGIDLGGRKLRKGAVDAVRRFAQQAGGSWPSAVSELVDVVARSGATPLVVADGARVLGVIELCDILKEGIREHCAALRRTGIRTIMVTGDNPLTAATIAADVGVDDFLAEATPEKKRDLIRRCQQEGLRVAMCGDGTNDAPALAQADVAVAMNSGTQAAKDAGNLVALDSNPTKFVTIVETGKQMLRTRRSLTTFSIAADLAKYFAIIPVALATTYPALSALNFTRLTSPRSALQSAAIFTALIVGPLFLLAMQGVKARAQSVARLSRRDLWVYALAGISLPWVGIKMIDVCLTAFRLV
jgi:K+-transporting ATPase ATPase B chain